MIMHHCQITITKQFIDTDFGLCTVIECTVSQLVFNKFTHLIHPIDRLSNLTGQIYLIVAQNAYCSRDIYFQFTKYFRSAIFPSIIHIYGRRRVSLVKINARFFP